MANYLLFQRCQKMVYRLVGTGGYHEWWHTRHIAFDRRTPAEQWLMDPESVYRFLIRQVN